MHLLALVLTLTGAAAIADGAFVRVDGAGFAVGDKPFAFVSVSADDEVKTLKDFLEKEAMPWTHWFAGKSSDVLKSWNIHAFPTIFVIDSKGVIRAKYVGAGPETEKKLEELVEKLVKEAS